MSSLQADQKFLLKSTLLNFMGTALKVISPILVIVVARVFGKEMFGLYVSTQLWVLTMSRIAVLGLDKGLHWYLPQNSVQGRAPYEGVMESFWRAVVIAIGITAIISGAALLGFHQMVEGLAELVPLEIILYILSLVPWVILHVFAGALEGYRKPQYKMFINDVAVATLTPLIGLGLFFLGLSGKSLPLGLLIANTLGALFYFFIVNKTFPQMPWWPGKKVSRALLSYSIPMGFSEVVVSFMQRADLWMVLAILGPGDAGIYAVMLTISNGLRTIRQGYTPILLPVVAGMSVERLRSDLKPVYTYCVSMVTLIQLAIGFFIVLFPEETLMIAGKSFVSRPEVLGVLLLANLLGGMFSLSGAVLNGMGKSRFMLMMNVVSLAIALGANYFLIPILGLAGAACSTLIYQMVQNIWMNVRLAQEKLWPYGRQLWVQGAWIVTIVGVYIANNTVLKLSFGNKAFIYVGALLGLLATLYGQGLTKNR